LKGLKVKVTANSKVNVIALCVRNGSADELQACCWPLNYSGERLGDVARPQVAMRHNCHILVD